MKKQLIIALVCVISGAGCFVAQAKPSKQDFAEQEALAQEALQPYLEQYLEQYDLEQGREVVRYLEKGYGLEQKMDLEDKLRSMRR